MSRILAVDDDEKMRELYTAALGGEGLEVRTAADATGAIMVCEDFKPDLLLLDWDMPGGGGRWVFEKIRELLGNPIPVLFVTGQPGAISVDLNTPRVRVLTKPVPVAELISFTRDLLK